MNNLLGLIHGKITSATKRIQTLLYLYTHVYGLCAHSVGICTKRRASIGTLFMFSEIRCHNIFRGKFFHTMNLSESVRQYFSLSRTILVSAGISLYSSLHGHCKPANINTIVYGYVLSIPVGAKRQPTLPFTDGIV